MTNFSTHCSNEFQWFKARSARRDVERYAWIETLRAHEWTHYISLAFRHDPPGDTEAIVNRFFWKLDSRVFKNQAGERKTRYFILHEDQSVRGNPTHLHVAGLVSVPEQGRERFERYWLEFWHDVNTELGEMPWRSQSNDLRAFAPADVDRVAGYTVKQFGTNDFPIISNL